MAQFRKMPFGKYTTIFYFLIALVLIEFISLAGVLAVSRPAEIPAADIHEPKNAVPVETETSALLPAEKQKPEGEQTGPEILAQNQIIAHGLGAIDGIGVLNCREGFESMYRQGVRVFEIDLRFTKDARLVLRHDWRPSWQEGVSEHSIPTLKEFLAEPILGKYTPLSFRDLLFLMAEHQDICIITDTKFTESDIVQIQFDAMVSEAADLGLTYLLDRFVVQFYNTSMYQSVDSVHHFSGYIYTLYQEKFDGTEDGFREFAAFCAEQKNVTGITISAEIWNSAYAGIAEEYGIKVFAHTINDPEQARSLFADGISAVYTDSLTPALLISDETEPNITKGD